MVRRAGRWWGSFALAGVLAVSLAWCASAGEEAGTSIPPAAEEHFNNAFFHASQENYDEAVREYREAIEIFPEYARAHHNLAMIFARAAKLELAIEHFRKALECPGLDEPWVVHNSLAIALEDSGDLEGAIAASRKAIELDPRPAFPLHNLAIALANNGDLAGALEAIRKAAELAPYDPRIARSVKILEERAARAAQAGPAEGQGTGAASIPGGTGAPATGAVGGPGTQEQSAPAGPSPAEVAGPLVPKALPPAAEPPVSFETGDSWRKTETASDAVFLDATEGEGRQARMEWWDDGESPASELAEAELEQVRQLDSGAQQEPWPEVGGREAAAYSYRLASEEGPAVRTRVVLVVGEGRVYRFTLRAEEQEFAQAEGAFRALLESVRFK
ncbi:MAG: tetratricopeptide repeat protein [Armatimonadetes bacterium]|nr:tetratricopeptide repeat protein [Armatimonadota bacterium]